MIEQKITEPLMISLEKLLTKANISIKDGWKRLAENRLKTLFVVDDHGILRGSVTDGDIRRWILTDQSIQESLSKVMNVNPMVALETDGEESIKEKMLAYRIECVPIVDINRRVTRVIAWDSLFQKKPKPIITQSINVPIIIMAGGRGVRLDPFTKILPKPLIPIGDISVLEMIIEKFRLYNVKKFFISLNYKAKMIKAYLDELPRDYDIIYIEETSPGGTAGALHLLQGKIDSTLMVSNCDILVDADYTDILKFHWENKCKITVVCSMQHFPIPYGVVEIENGGILKKIREKPEFDFLVNTGLYVMEPELLGRIPSDGVYHITYLIEKLRQENEKVGVYPISTESWIDIGELDEYKEILMRFRKIP